MTTQSDASIFWSFLPMWIAIWLIVAMISLVINRRHGWYTIAECLAIALITAYATTHFPWLWRTLLGGEPETVGASQHVTELTMQVAVAMLCGLSIVVAECVYWLIHISPRIVRFAGKLPPVQFAGRELRLIHHVASVQTDEPVVE